MTLSLIFPAETYQMLRSLAHGATAVAQASSAPALLAELALPDLHLYPHQRRAVRRVVNALQGRALLADEVGLGKTVEAGVILKEYQLRGLVHRSLILTPASLLAQWQAELRRTCGISAEIAAGRQGWEAPVVLASLELAKQPANRNLIRSWTYDLVIVDEAHALKNPASDNWRLVNELEATYMLLLTATPLQNGLRDLHSLVSLLRPGLLPPEKQFRLAYEGGNGEVKDPIALRRTLARVMVRTTQEMAHVKLPPSQVQTLAVDVLPGEADLYAACLELLWEAGRRERNRQRVLPFVVLLREAASSPLAAGRTLVRMARHPGLPAPVAARYRAVGARAKGIIPAKLGALQKLIAQCDGKVLVFTEFRGTQDLFSAALAASGIPCVKYHGQMSGPVQAEAVAAFAGDRARVMVATEAAAEGHNLQFCHHLVNLDLPWNPARVEQRVGRLHRLGQRSAVSVVNLVARGTVDEHVVEILAAKAGLFSVVLGAAASYPGAGFEWEVAKRVIANRDAAALARSLDELGAEVAAQRDAVRASVAQNRAWFGG